MPRIHTAVVPDRTEKIAFFCRDEHENPLPSPVLETGPVHLAPGDTVVIQSPMNERGDRPLVIYIAGPYFAPTLAEREANTRRAMDAFLAILARGHYPICPHLSHYPHEFHIAKTQREIPYNVWIELDRQYLVRSDAIYYMAPSPGADGELRLAKRCGKIVFRSMDDVPDLTGGKWWRGLVPVETRPEQLWICPAAKECGVKDCFGLSAHKHTNDGPTECLRPDGISGAHCVPYVEPVAAGRKVLHTQEFKITADPLTVTPVNAPSAMVDETREIDELRAQVDHLLGLLEPFKAEDWTEDCWCYHLPDSAEIERLRDELETISQTASNWEKGQVRLARVLNEREDEIERLKSVIEVLTQGTTKYSKDNAALNHAYCAQNVEIERLKAELADLKRGRIHPESYPLEPEKEPDRRDTRTRVEDGRAEENTLVQIWDGHREYVGYRYNDIWITLSEDGRIIIVQHATHWRSLPWSPFAPVPEPTYTVAERGVMPPLPKDGIGQSGDAPVRPTPPEPVIADEADAKPFLPKKPTPPTARYLREGDIPGKVPIRQWRWWPWNWWRKSKSFSPQRGYNPPPVEKVERPRPSPSVAPPLPRGGTGQSKE
jgi:hypothetical protein